MYTRFKSFKVTHKPREVSMELLFTYRSLFCVDLVDTRIRDMSVFPLPTEVVPSIEELITIWCDTEYYRPYFLITAV